MKGRLIVFEGIDKSGKETQARLLVRHLKSRGIDAIYTAEPDDQNPVGRFIRAWLGGKFDIKSGEAVSMLYTADRYEHVKRVIRPALEAGKTVVLDRYYFSALAYSSAMYGISREWLREMNRDVPKPDIVILMDIDPAVSLERRRGRPNDRLEKAELLKKVREAYIELSNEEKGFFVVDANRPKEEVFESVKGIIGRMGFE